MNVCKIYYWLFTSLTVLAPYAHAQSPADFRQVRWGFTPRQVKEAEASKPSATKRERLTYARVPLADRTVGLDYNFNGDSLLSASYYYYTTAAVMKEDVMAAAADFESKLTEKYGRGKTAMLQDTRRVLWLTPRTQISLSIGNVDKGWSVEIEYLCRVCAPNQPVGKPADVYRPLKDIKDF
ncbi:hypothetical protein [Spirosoma koreense]